MDNDLINSKAVDVPIVRATSSERLATFNANSNSIYNKFSPFTKYGSIGPSQPFVYTKISDSTFFKNLTRYDTQVLPIGSTARDVKRIGQFLVTGTGLLYIGKQLLLQQQNAFNETRVYNPLSVLKATIRPASLGAIGYPQRHLETSGGLLNFFKDALLSTIGFQTKDSEKPRIEGTATGGDNGVAYSAYVGSHGGGRAGLLRLGTAKAASTIFESTWVANPSQGDTNGGFLANLGKSLVNKLKSLIPSTNPLGAFGGEASDTWAYRPEYKKGKDGAYYAFLADNSGFLTVNAPASQLFYNDAKFATATAASKATVLLVSDYHKYYPQKQQDKNSRVWYANKTKIQDDAVGIKDEEGYQNNLKSLQSRMIEAIDNSGDGTDTANQFKRSAERYNAVKDTQGKSYPAYKDIPDTTLVKNGKLKYDDGIDRTGAISVDKRWFAKVTVNDPEKSYRNRVGADQYNSLDVIKGERGKIPTELQYQDLTNSKDLIYFFFFDIINNVYVPFRATVSSVSDQHSAEYEDLSYIGRADKLFLYKGFSRDVSFAFRVYANSADEMLPMWNRINYLVGLTRPSKYTESAFVTNANATGSFTGNESKFIYPPMTTLTLGDLYVDQPCILSSVSINVPDDSLWESLRADDYNYVYGYNQEENAPKEIKRSGVKSRQLPTIVDVSVTLKILEKSRSLGSAAHFGKVDQNGNRWVL